MAVTSTNLIQGPATVYHGLFGATEPATIATAPGAGWTDAGGTKDGVALDIESTWSDLTVDQLIDVVARRRVGRLVAVRTSLAEPTLANLAQAVANTAPVSNVLEGDDGLGAFAPAYGAILVDGIAPGGFRRRITLRKTLPIDNVGLEYKKDGQTLIPVRWAIHWVSTSIKPWKIEDATS
jgi:hypothetical protein